MAGKNGGARPGAGRKKGKPNAKTLERMAVAEAYNQRIMQTADKLFVAQAQLALGSMKVVRIDEEKDEKGKIKRVYVPVIDTQEIIDLLNEHDGLPGEVNGSYYFFQDVPPDNKSLDSMLNRGLGKPKETVEVTHPDAVVIAKKVVEQLLSEGKDKGEAVKYASGRYNVAEADLGVVG